MKFRQLEYFVAAAECGSFSKAAAQLYVAQPSLSQQIRALEETLGARLIDREFNARAFRLTPAGAALLPEARAILAAVERGRTAVRNAQAGIGQELTVMSVRSVAANVLPRTLAVWHAKHPDTPLSLRDFTHRDLLEVAMSAGEGDVGIGPRPRRWNGPIHSIGYEELVLVSRDLADIVSAGSDPHLLTDRPWVLFDVAHGLTEVVSLFFAKYGIAPRIAARCAQVEAALSLSLDGMGITLLPENVVPHDIRAKHTVRAGGGVFRELVAYTTETPNSRVACFIELLSELDCELDRPVRATQADPLLC